MSIADKKSPLIEEQSLSDQWNDLNKFSDGRVWDEDTGSWAWPDEAEDDLYVEISL